MRLLFIAEKYAPDLGGVSASATRISRQIAEIGSEVEVFCFTGRLQAGQVTVEESAPGLRIHRMGEAKNLDYSLQLAVTYLDWLHEQRAVTAVWGHYVSTAGFLAAWFARRRGLKSILSVRGNDFDRQLFPPGDLARLQWSLTAGDYITVVSRELSNHVRAFCGRTSMVLPNAVDGDTFTPGTRNSELTQKFGLKPSEIVLGFVGELRAKKGLQFLLATLQALLNLQETRLLVIGELRSADQGVWARALASDERLASAIFITGHLSASADVAAHLRLADVFLLPALWDGMPNSVLEAMATGVPVVASDAGGIPELIDDGVTGLLVPRTHLHQMSERVQELLAMPANARAAMTGAARRVAVEHFSLARERERLAEVLQAALSGAGNGL